MVAGGRFMPPPLSEQRMNLQSEEYEYSLRQGNLRGLQQFEGSLVVVHTSYNQLQSQPGRGKGIYFSILF